MFAAFNRKGRTKHKAMTLPADEVIMRCLMHELAKDFRRIRHYG